MRLLSLRPERSASANSATSAYGVRVVFYLKRDFCQLWEQMKGQRRPQRDLFISEKQTNYSNARNISFAPGSGYSIYQERSCKMFILAAIISFFCLVLAGSDLFVSQYNSDELSNMGVQQK
jgi:hypothetical protein